MLANRRARSITFAVLAVGLVAVAAVALVTALQQARALVYHWDRRPICSINIDDHMRAVRWDEIDAAMRVAALDDGVVAFHGHVPGITISRAMIVQLLALAARHHLATLTFREIANGPHVAGIALAFDDNAPIEWASLRELLAARHVHATFFVTRWQDMSVEERAAVQRLADAGHDIEPHGANHEHAPDYARAHGIAAYLHDEVEPSLADMRAAGFAPTTFAYPYGEHTAELDAALLGVVTLVRTTSSRCSR